MCSNASEIAAGILKFGMHGPRNNKTRGRVVRNQGNTFPDKKGFTTQDILWAIGVWSVILTLSPVVVFYLLMVN